MVFPPAPDGGIGVGLEREVIFETGRLGEEVAEGIVGGAEEVTEGSLGEELLAAGIAGKGPSLLMLPLLIRVLLRRGCSVSSRLSWVSS